jgi:dipeptidyl aminopeptidase/acylaminoacyl peptidase
MRIIKTAVLGVVAGWLAAGCGWAAQPEPKVYRERLEPHWFAGRTCFWYRNDNPGGAREFILVEAGPGVRRAAFDHQRVAELLQKAGHPAAADQLPIDQLAFAEDLGSVELHGPGKSWLLNLRSYELKERTAEPAAAASLPASLPASLQPRPSRRTGEETSLRFLNRTAGDIDLFWLDSEGERRRYASLKPGGQWDQHTFAGHVWLAADPAGKILGVFEATGERSTAVVDGSGATAKPATAPQRRTRRPNPGGADSPDGQWTVFLKDNNLHLRSRKTGEEWPLSRDGKPGDSYATDRLWWSPDAEKLAAMRVEKGQEHPVNIVESSPKDQLQPKLRTMDYLKPGDRVAHPRPQLFHVASRRQVPIAEELFANPWSIEDLRWAADSSRFTFVYNQRGHQVLRLVAVGAQSGVARPLIVERSDTFVCYSGNYYCEWLGDQEVVWMSERDGWNHLWLYDAENGRVKNQITQGPWVVQGITHLDREKRQVWFRAGGLIPGQDPYYTHFCRVDLDGSRLQVLTQGDGQHSVQWNPGDACFIDTWSRVDLPPVHELRRAGPGGLVCALETADASEALAARHGRWPERFTAKGRDGAADIFGVIIRPRDFDPAKKYPVVENIYAGPQGFFAPKAFRARYGHQQQIADRGIIVVQCDGMGTAGRSKKFHDVCFKNLRDAGFPDRIAWLKAAAASRPEMDLGRVGIYGGSAGGQNALAALLWHGDFYRVAVADCGCHDNRMDKIWWNEQWMGWPVDKSYADNSNAVNAHLLQGKLMLVVGELDSNVDPASTMQVVGALQKANQDFDLVVIVGASHGAAETPYGSRRRADFLAQHLLQPK